MNEHIFTVHEGKKKSNEVDECYESGKEENSGKYANNFQTCQFCFENVSNLNEHIKNCSKYQKSMFNIDDIKKEWLPSRLITNHLSFVIFIAFLQLYQ